MGRIFNIQLKDTYKFRRKTRRKLRKGDVVRIQGDNTNFPDSRIRAQLDLRPQTKDVLFSKVRNPTLRGDNTIKVLDNGS